MKTPIGLDKDSREIRLIEDVESGLKCNCICPECKAPLIAKKGPIKADHFSHYKTTEQQACRETAVHLMAKHVLLNAPTVLFPTYRYSPKSIYSRLREPFGSTSEFLLEPIKVWDAQEEVYLSDLRIKPDIMCTTVIEGLELEVAIEVAVTHEVEDDKAKKIAAANLASFEIDLSDLTDTPHLTFDDIKTALDDKTRLSWINESETLRKHLHDICRSKALKARDERDREIAAWADRIRAYFRTTGTLALPKYPLPSTLTSYDKDWADNYVKPTLPATPMLPTRLQIRDITGPDKALLEAKCIASERQFRLCISIQLPHAKATAPKASYLRLDVTELPSPQELEQQLKWGKSSVMDEHISAVRTIKQQALKTANDKIKKDLQHRIEWFNDIRSGAKQPAFHNIDRIQHDYHQALMELTHKGIPAKQWTKNYKDGWIFGCPNEYWQILLIRTICLLNNDGVNTKYYADSLKKHHGIDAIEPIRTLTFRKGVLHKVGFDPDLVPSTYKILWDFFQHLEQHNVLKKWGRGQFVKLIPFGHEYRAL